MLTKQEVATEWDRISTLLTQKLRRPFPLFDDLDFKFDNAQTRLAGIGEGPFGRIHLRISKTFCPPAVSHDFIIAITHEMCHIGDWTHGKKWQRDYRIALNALGYRKHPVTRVYTPYLASDHPDMPALPEFGPAMRPARTRGWMYYCDCPGRTEGEGGYGIRSRRTLDGRKCVHCNVLNVKYVNE